MMEPGLTAAMLDVLLRATHDGVCVLTGEGKIAYVNPVAATLLQQPSEELQGQSFGDLCSFGVSGEALAAGMMVFGYAAYRQDGVPLLVDAYPLLREGQPCGGVIVIKDERELRVKAEELRIAEFKVECLEKRLNQFWTPQQWVGESWEQRQIRKMKAGKGFDKFIGMTDAVIEILGLAAKAAKVHSTVLICGKSGTGKEVLAEGIHVSSPRAAGPFIKVNCAAIPVNLLESELFGHEKGAFTGAIRRKLGKFEQAHQGTLFLDEIGELDLAMQSKLLRVLQTNTFERVGGEQSITVDVRIVAATNRDMAAMVREGTFREDLYYRLNVIPLELPPLKERKEDIPLLVDHFLKKFNRDFGRNIKGIKKPAMEALVEYDWPGNVRELRNIIERLVVLTDDVYIELHDLPTQLWQEAAPARPQLALADKLHKEIFPLEEYEKEIIQAALERYGSYTAAGKALGITHKTVAAKAQKYGIGKVQEK